MSDKRDPHHFENDAALIAAMLEGDSTAFETAVALYHPRMVTIAKAIIGEAFAEEIAQDAWISAIRSLSEFAGRSSLNTWLIQITANAAKTRLRREKRQVSLDENWQKKKQMIVLIILVIGKNRLLNGNWKPQKPFWPIVNSATSSARPSINFHHNSKLY